VFNFAQTRRDACRRMHWPVQGLPAVCKPYQTHRVGFFRGAWTMSANTHFPYPSYARPPCSKCGATMMLSRVDRGDLNYGKRTFDCVP